MLKTNGLKRLRKSILTSDDWQLRLLIRPDRIRNINAAKKRLGGYKRWMKYLYPSANW